LCKLPGSPGSFCLKEAVCHLLLLKTCTETGYQPEILNCSNTDLLKSTHVVFFASILMLSGPEVQVSDTTKVSLKNKPLTS
jgi:hypothetical protein